MQSKISARGPQAICLPWRKCIVLMLDLPAIMNPPCTRTTADFCIRTRMLRFPHLRSKRLTSKDKDPRLLDRQKDASNLEGLLVCPAIARCLRWQTTQDQRPRPVCHLLPSRVENQYNTHFTIHVLEALGKIGDAGAQR